LSCVLRISGKHFLVDEFLAESGLQAIASWQVGSPRLDQEMHTRAGCNIAVSNAEMTDLKTQLNDAIRFLERHGQILSRAVEFGVTAGEVPELDFAIESRLEATPVQSDRLPLELIRLVGHARCSICLTQYE